MDVITEKKKGKLFVDRAQLKRKQALGAYLNNKRHKTGIFNCCSGKAVLFNYNNFRNSGIPSRLMYFRKGEWIDFEAQAAALMKEAFRDGKTAVEITIGGFSYLVDFLRMSQIDLRNGCQRLIAWIDTAGKCFFPQVFCETQDEIDSPSIDVKIDLRINGKECSRTGKCELVSNFVPDILAETGNLHGKTAPSDFESENESTCAGQDLSSENIVSECGSEVRSSVSGVCSVRSTSPGSGLLGNNSIKLEKVDQCQGEVRVSESGTRTSCLNTSPFGLSDDNLIKLEEGDREFAAVRSKFLAGLSTLVTFTSVVGIYRNTHSSISGHARLQAFRSHVHEMMTRKSMGNPNLRYAWHGTSRKAVSGIIQHGFGQPKAPKNGAAYGNGVYLAPEDCSNISVAYADVDENGEQHVLFCRVIMGNIEHIRPGSKQFHPSSEQFDTGVDDLKNPKRYIVWSTHMNTHILPEYIVSFKVSPQLREYLSVLKAKQGAIAVQGNPSCLQDGDLRHLRSTIGMEGVKQPSPALVKEEEHKMQGPVRMPSSAWMSFSKLFSVLGKFLPSSSITLMENHYADYKEGKISREDLIRKVRLIAGDKLLIAAIKIFQGQGLPSMKEKNPLLMN